MGDGVVFSFENDVMVAKAKERAAEETARAIAKELEDATAAAKAAAREYWLARQEEGAYPDGADEIAKFKEEIADGTAESLVTALARRSPAAIEEFDDESFRDQFLRHDEKALAEADFWRWFNEELDEDDDRWDVALRTFNGLPPVLETAKRRADAIDALEEDLEFDEEPDSSFKRDVTKIVSKAMEAADEGEVVALAFVDYEDEDFRFPIVTFSPDAPPELNDAMAREARSNFAAIDEMNGAAISFSTKQGEMRVSAFVPVQFGFACVDEDEAIAIVNEFVASTAGTPWQDFAMAIANEFKVEKADLGLDGDGSDC